MSSRLLAYSSHYPKLYPNLVISCSRNQSFASSSKHPPSRSSSVQEPDTILFDAPSRPSELTRRSARSSSLIDYYSSRRRLVSSPARQTRSSASSSSNSATSSTSSTGNVSPQIFDRPSKPRAYYVRPQRKQDLPRLESRLGIFIVLTVAGFGAWAAFIFYATNMERASSSVVRQLALNLKEAEAVKEILGENIRLEEKWWLGGEPYIDGAINLLQGNVDVSFRIIGSKGSGTVYFTSVRQEKGQPFTILRSKVICDNGQIVQLKAGKHFGL